MADPLAAGAVQLTLTWVAFLVEAVIPVGVPGGVAGVTELEAVDWLPVPTPLVADTLKVYAVPRLSPVMVVEVTLGPARLVYVHPPQAGLGVTV